MNLVKWIQWLSRTGARSFEWVSLSNFVKHAFSTLSTTVCNAGKLKLIALPSANERKCNIDYRYTHMDFSLEKLVKHVTISDGHYAVQSHRAIWGRALWCYCRTFFIYQKSFRLDTYSYSSSSRVGVWLKQNKWGFLKTTLSIGDKLISPEVSWFQLKMAHAILGL